MFDAAIIGTGPAGLSAALNLKIHQKSFIWLGSKSLSKKIQKAEKVMNYPGLSNVTGEEMLGVFLKQVEDMKLDISEEMVNSIMFLGDHYYLMAGSNVYEAKTIILATGITNVGRITGEENLVGKGVSYCATCDGMLYRGKTISVISNSNRFEHEVEYLSNLAEKVYFFPTYKDYKISKNNIEVYNTRPTAIMGENKVEGIELNDGSKVEVDGIFCLRDSIALSTLLPDLKLEDGHMAVNRKMETNLPGCFAAGDCTGRPYQYTKAVGEGNIAAHSLIEYLAKEEKR